MSTAMTTNGGTAKPARTLKDLLESLKPTLASVLPKHLTPERMIKVANSAYVRTPELQKCTDMSIVSCVVQAAELGLEAGGLLGEAYLVPFNTKVKTPQGDKWVKEARLIPGYRGLIKLARQSGEVSTVYAHVVHENDFFEVEYGLALDVKHRPNFRADRGQKIAAYAVCRMKDGGFQLDVMTKGEIELVRARSKAANAGPWVTDEAEMWRKTVVRRMLKYAPLSAERLRAAQEHDDRVDGPVVDVDFTVGGESIDTAEIPPPVTRGKRLATKIAAKSAAAEGHGAAAPDAEDEPPSESVPEETPGEPEPEGPAS